MIVQEVRETLTPREREELDWEKQLSRMQMDYGLKVEQLKADIAKLEAKWTVVFRIPLEVICLPVKLVLALAIPICMISGYQLPKEYWEFMK